MVVMGWQHYSTLSILTSACLWACVLPYDTYENTAVHRTLKRAIRDPPRQGLGLSGTLRAADKIDYVTLWIVARTGFEHEGRLGGKLPNPISQVRNLSPTLIPPIPRWFDS